MTNNGVSLSAQEVEPWGFGFFPIHGPLHFIIRKFLFLAFFISLKSQFGVLQQALTPK